MPNAFPESHWGSEQLSPHFGPAYRFASSALGSRIIRLFVPLDRRVLAATKGRYTLFGPTTLPTLLLTTTGRTSGLARRSPLNFLRDGDRLLVLGSNFGQQQHPGWSSNLLALPEATVAIAGAQIPVRARLLAGDEREQALGLFLRYPMYRSYLSRTERDLRLFALVRR